MNLERLNVANIELYIDAPIDYVFKCLDDDAIIVKWNSFLIENIYETPDDYLYPKPGMKFQSVQRFGKKQYTFDAEMTAYNSPYHVGLKVSTKEGISFTDYYLERAGSHTKLIVELSTIPSNWWQRTLTKLFGWAAKGMYQEEYEKLKEYVEETYDWEQDIE